MFDAQFYVHRLDPGNEAAVLRIVMQMNGKSTTTEKLKMHAKAI